MNLPRLACLLLCGFLLTNLGCGSSTKHETAKIADLEKKNAALEAELAKIKDSLKTSSVKSSPGYLNDLEQLASLVNKGTLTPIEFEEQKKRILLSSFPSAVTSPTTSPSNAASPLTMTDLAKQLRLLQELTASNTITLIERDDKKRQALAKPLVLVDLKADLELVTTLSQENTITLIERDELKKKLLQLEPVGK